MSDESSKTSRSRSVWEIHWKKTRGKQSTDLGLALRETHTVAYLRAVGPEARTELKRLIKEAEKDG